MSDYGKGGLTHVARMVQLARRRQAGADRPRRATTEQIRRRHPLTPNKSEFRQVAGSWRDEADLAQRAQTLRQQLQLDALLVTRSEKA